MLPLLPVATLVFGFGWLDVTSDPPMGLVTLHEMLMLHELAPDGMVQDEGESESVPEGAAARRKFRRAWRSRVASSR